MVVIFLGAMSGCHVSQPADIFTLTMTVVEEDDETIEICLPKIGIPTLVVGPEKDMRGSMLTRLSKIYWKRTYLQVFSLVSCFTLAKDMLHWRYA